MEWWQIVLIVLALAGFVAFVLWLKHRSNEAHYIDGEFVSYGIDKKYRQFNDKFTVSTSRGARVRSTVAVPTDFLTIIDTGLQSQIDRYNTKFPDWANHKLISDYDILIIDPMGINEETEPGSPHLKVNGISTAGTVLGMHWLSNLKKPFIVVPHQKQQGWRFVDYFKWSIANESEHARERANRMFAPIDLYKYYMTVEDQHPHRLPGDGESLASAQIPCAMQKDWRG